MPKSRVTNQHIVMKQDGLELYIFEDIDSFWGFSSLELAEALKTIPPDAEVTVYINSSGGEVFQGLAIYNLLTSHKGPVTTVVTGIAASIASVIFLAGKRRRMFDNTMLMVHNPTFTAISGNREELEGSLELLKKAEKTIVDIYLGRTGATAEQVTGWLSKDTYFTADESLKNGFATEIIDAPKVEVRGASLSELIAHLKTRNTSMPAKKRLLDNAKFRQFVDTYCEPFRLSVDDLDDEMIESLKGKFDAQPQARAPAREEEGDLSRSRDRESQELERVEAIRGYIRDHGDEPLNEEYAKTLGTKATTVRGLGSHAIRQGWDLDRFELECRRGERKDIGEFAIHVKSGIEDLATGAIACALARNSGMVASRKNVSGRDFGYEHAWSEQELDGSHDPRIADIGLLGTLHMAYQQANGHAYHGRLNTDGFIGAAREAMWKLRSFNTTWTGLNIFDDVANKMLWAAYEAQNTTWERWIYSVSVSDFKTYNMYRLSMTGGYRQVGSDGELKHGSFTDDKYQIAANTYGKIVGLARRDIINDDLGALTRIMTMLGIEGAKFLEELFYGYLLDNIPTLFSAALGNYIEGAATVLGVDGLTQAEMVFMNQVDADNAPMLVNPSLLLVGTALGVVAAELYTQLQLVSTTFTNAKVRPNGNPHVGKFDPIVTPYLSNAALRARTDANTTAIGAAFSNQSATQWFMLAEPNTGMGSVINGAFLNGQRRPVIEQADAPFNVLGLQWRAYHDAGVGSGDPKLGVHSKGAA